MRAYTCSCEAYKLEIANLESRLSKAKSLLREVIAWESNPESPCYNSCDKRPCEWCREAIEIVEK